jgi:hypothetical protein
MSMVDFVKWSRRMDARFLLGPEKCVEEILDYAIAVAALTGKDPRDLLRRLADADELWNDTALAAARDRVKELSGQ